MEEDQAGLDLTKKFEGLRLRAYQDSVGVWTIGYGHTGKDVMEGTVITEQQAIAMLISDISTAVAAVNRLVKVGLTQNQFDALVDFVFNLGVKAFQNSTLLLKLNKLDYPGAAEEFLKWDHAGGKVLSGLLARRQTEEAMFEAAMPPHVVPTPSDLTRVNPTSNSPHAVNWLTSAITEIINLFRGSNENSSQA
jgi:lysozyme